MAFHVAPALEDDVPRLMEIQFAAFSYDPAHAMVNGQDTPENRSEAGARLLEQMRTDPFLHTIQCTHTDPITNTDTIVGFCLWYVYDRPRTRDEWMAEHPILTLTWLPEGPERETAKAGILPMFTGRRKLEGKPHALLLYMSVDPAWQRRGVGMLLMGWGARRTDELGIPAYLEASRFGVPMYKRCGYVDFEPIVMVVGGEEQRYPTMMRWPAKVRAEWEGWRERKHGV